jgi:PleD family two-component response regulator
MTKKYKILVVDDERAIADTLAAILDSTFDVYVAYSGSQALDTVALIEPDLVLRRVDAGQKWIGSCNRDQ